MKLNVNKLNAQTKWAIDKEYKSLIKSVDEEINDKVNKGEYYVFVDSNYASKSNYEKMIEHYKGLGFNVTRKFEGETIDHVFIDWKMEEK